MNSPVRLVRGFFTVGVWTLASRILGFLRDILIASFLGSGPVAEAFLIAFSLPNMFRRFFAEGAFNMAFVPMFAKRVETGENAEGFASDALSGLAAVLLVLMALAHLAMPWLVYAMASGFAGDARFGLAVDYGRIAFPYILFISLTALFSAALNATGRFAAAAAAPAMLNLVFIAAMLLAVRSGWDMGLTLAWAVPVAGILQLALTWWASVHAGLRLRLRRPRLTPEMRRLAVIAAPALLAGGVVQINLIVGRQVASFTEGAVAWLSYADRLYQLPLGVVGIAIGVVLLPDLSRRLRAGDEGGGQRAFSRATEFALALTLPAAAALVVVPVPLVTVLFQRGAFDAADAAATALALAIYGAGLPAFVMQKVLQPLYYAREDTRRPFNYAVVAMLVNAALAVGLSHVIGFIAAAIGTTLAGWVMAWQLWRGVRGMGTAAQPDARLRRRLPRILAATVAMAVGLWLLAAALGPAWADPVWRGPALAGLVVAGMALYAVAAQVFGAFTLVDLRSALRRDRR